MSSAPQKKLSIENKRLFVKMAYVALSSNRAIFVDFTMKIDDMKGNLCSNYYINILSQFVLIDILRASDLGRINMFLF